MRPFDTHQGSGDRPNLHQLRWLPAAQVAARPPGPRSAARLAGASKPAAAPGVPRCSRAEQRGGRAFALIVRWPGLFIPAPLRRVILAPGQRLTAAAKVARARRSFTPDRMIRPQRSERTPRLPHRPIDRALHAGRRGRHDRLGDRGCPKRSSLAGPSARIAEVMLGFLPSGEGWSQRKRFREALRPRGSSIAGNWARRATPPSHQRSA